MNQKILWMMADVFRQSPLPRRDWLTLSLQLMAWSKLDVANDTQPSRTLSIACDAGNDAIAAGLAALESSTEGVAGAFYGAKTMAEAAGSQLQPAASLCNRLQHDGLLSELRIDELIYDVVSETSHEPDVYHPSLAALMARLAMPLRGDSVYCPWDNKAQITCSVMRAGAAMVAVENQWMSAYPALAGVFSDADASIAFGDPIAAPSYVKAGRLTKFDKSVAFPPMGFKPPADITSKDLFGRFVNTRSTWPVLCIEHLLAQTKSVVVVAVPFSFLQGLGSDKALRERLVEEGRVRAVLSLPAGLLLGTAIQVAVLVLDLQGSHQSIRFVNGNHELFKQRTAKTRSELRNLDQLVEEVSSDKRSLHAYTASVGEVRENDWSLLVDRYVLEPSAAELKARLRKARTAALADLVSSVRTFPLSAKAKQLGVPVLEIGASDLPANGYIQGGREITVDAAAIDKHSKLFLRASDLVLIIRGNVGKVGIVPEDVPLPGEGGWVAGSSLAVLRPAPGASVDPHALLLLLRSPLGQELIATIASGVSVPMITLRDLMRLEVPLPHAQSGEQARKVLDTERALQVEIERLRREQQQVAGSEFALGMLG